jgi:hypothetical protein
MLPNTSHITRPPCAKCGKPTLLMRISPRSAGMEVQMFECPSCSHVMEHICKAQPPSPWLNSGLQRPD